MSPPTPSEAPDGTASGRFQDSLSRAAATDATVLLTGESGTGKSLAARWLHERGNRRQGPFVSVSLAALSPTLVAAELFGHEAGAFTGAQRARRGRFRQADGGTLVLDDVAAMPPVTQGKLLRVLQERVVEPLGAEDPVPIDVRIVVTTAVDLPREVEAGRFRADLYYRLAVVELAVPPLRDPAGELGALAESLIGSIADRLGVPVRPVSSEALARLEAHPWPGNVRELENTLERVLVLGTRAAGAAIDATELEFLGEAVDGIADDIAQRALAHGLTLEDLERSVLAAALAESRGNVSAAARKIGLTRRAFEYRWSRAGGAEESADASSEGPVDGPTK